MKLTDLLPLEAWVELEKEIAEKSGLSASVFDIDGIRITDHKNWSNKLCPVVKANEKGQTFICAAAHQNISTMAMQSREPVIEECDAGLTKIVVPIFAHGEFLGGAGGCGLLGEEGEVETFLIGQVTGIGEEELEALSEGIGVIKERDAEATAKFIQERIRKIVSDYEEGRR